MDISCYVCLICKEFIGIASKKKKKTLIIKKKQILKRTEHITSCIIL